MGWTQDEIIENEKLWMQENPDHAAGISSPLTSNPDLKSVGVNNPSEVPDAPQGDAPDMGGASEAGSTF